MMGDDPQPVLPILPYARPSQHQEEVRVPAGYGYGPRGELIHTSKGATLRVRHCPRCATVFGYYLSRMAQGYVNRREGITEMAARELAASRSQDRLRWLLEVGIDVVPCPGCQHFPDYMREELVFDRFRKRYSRVGAIIVFSVGFFALAGAAAMTPYTRRSLHGWLIFCACAGLMLMLAAFVAGRVVLAAESKFRQRITSGDFASELTELPVILLPSGSLDGEFVELVPEGNEPTLKPLTISREHWLLYVKASEEVERLRSAPLTRWQKLWVYIQNGTLTRWKAKSLYN